MGTDMADSALQGEQQGEVRQEPVAWKVIPRYEDEQGYFDFTDNGDAVETLIARGWRAIPLYAAPLCSRPQQEGDERVSDLREALREATEALAGGLWDYGPGQDEHEKCNEVIARCRAALAATPKEPAQQGSSEAAPAARDEVLETLIEESGGHWREDVFVIGCSELWALLQAVSAQVSPKEKSDA
jgi:hypothetical protein